MPLECDCIRSERIIHAAKSAATVNALNKRHPAIQIYRRRLIREERHHEILISDQRCAYFARSLHQHPCGGRHSVLSKQAHPVRRALYGRRPDRNQLIKQQQ
jgi:hypothetical protein